MRHTTRYEMYVVTKKPTDYPDFEYVARYWWNNKPTADAVLMKDDIALTRFRNNLLLSHWGRITRVEGDEPGIIETWMRVAR